MDRAEKCKLNVQNRLKRKDHAGFGQREDTSVVHQIKASLQNPAGGDNPLSKDDHLSINSIYGGAGAPNAAGRNAGTTGTGGDPRARSKSPSGAAT